MYGSYRKDFSHGEGTGPDLEAAGPALKSSGQNMGRINSASSHV